MGHPAKLKSHFAPLFSSLVFALILSACQAKVAGVEQNSLGADPIEIVPLDKKFTLSKNTFFFWKQYPELPEAESNARRASDIAQAQLISKGITRCDDEAERLGARIRASTATCKAACSVAAEIEACQQKCQSDQDTLVDSLSLQMSAVYDDRYDEAMGEMIPGLRSRRIELWKERRKPSRDASRITTLETTIRSIETEASSLEARLARPDGGLIGASPSITSEVVRDQIDLKRVEFEGTEFVNKLSETVIRFEQAPKFITFEPGPDGSPKIQLSGWCTDPAANSSCPSFSTHQEEPAPNKKWFVIVPDEASGAPLYDEKSSRLRFRAEIRGKAIAIENTTYRRLEGYYVFNFSKVNALETARTGRFYYSGNFWEFLPTVEHHTRFVETRKGAVRMSGQ